MKIRIRQQYHYLVHVYGYSMVMNQLLQLCRHEMVMDGGSNEIRMR